MIGVCVCVGAHTSWHIHVEMSRWHYGFKSLLLPFHVFRGSNSQCHDSMTSAFTCWSLLLPQPPSGVGVSHQSWEYFPYYFGRKENVFASKGIWIFGCWHYKIIPNDRADGLDILRSFLLESTLCVWVTETGASYGGQVGLEFIIPLILALGARI